MKKLIYSTGIVCIMTMLFGSMFKIMHWPGANVLLIVCVFLFCFCFLPVALFSSYNSQASPKYKSLYIITYIVFSICMMAVLFRVLHWPGAAIFVMIGVPLPFLLFLPVYLFQTRNERSEDNTNFLGLMFGLIFLAVFSVMLVFGTSKLILKNGITRVYSLEKTRVFEEEVLTQMKQDNNIVSSSDDLCDFIEKIKDELLDVSQRNLNSGIEVHTKYHWAMANIDDKSITRDLLFNLSGENKFAQLMEKVQKYQASLVETRKMSPGLTALTNQIFNVGNTTHPDRQGTLEELDWEQREFSNKQLIFILGALTQLQCNVRAVELEYLASLK